MPNIDNELGRIKTAIRGEDMRSAIYNAMRILASDATRMDSKISEQSRSLEEISLSTNNKIKEVQLIAEGKADEFSYDKENNLLYLASGDEIISNPVSVAAGGGGGGGGGSADNDAVMSPLRNVSGWSTKTISMNEKCEFTFYWDSTIDGVPTGGGSVQITIANASRAIIPVEQGEVTIDLAPYLGSGTNNVILMVKDLYGSRKVLRLSITLIEFRLTSNSDFSAPFTSDIPFSYIASASVMKTIYFLVDGDVIDTVVTSSTSQRNYMIPAQSHGAHSILCYYEAEVNGQTVKSNELYYEFTSIEPGNTSPIITSNFRKSEVKQYDTLNIGYTVYNPAAATTDIVIKANGTQVSALNVDSSAQVFVYRASKAGTLNIEISTGRQGSSDYASKTITMTVEASDVTIEPVTDNLALYLTSQGRSNNEEHRDEWKSGNVEAVLTGFNWRINGWMQDSDGVTVMRVSGGAHIYIPFNIFENDFKTNGKTIEVEFATREVIDYSAAIFSCFSDNIGLRITPQTVYFNGAQTSLFAPYKDNEHIRLSIVVSKQTNYRRIQIYINGIISGAVQYASGERFSQLTPVGIDIGSNNCGIDLYNIRVYDTELDPSQIVNNWIADTQVGTLMIDRFTHNDIYDSETGEITPDSLPSDLPYWIINAEELPQYKGDKKTVSGSYTDPVNSAKSFSFEGCQINVQGTSSAIYYRKNYDLQFKNGFIMNTGNANTYALRSNSIPFNRFVLKADVASSESANNTVLTMFYSDSNPYRTPEQVTNPNVRQGIEGLPCVVFWYDEKEKKLKFMGKYNFNLPKRAPKPYGYSGNMESWEWERNNSANVKFQDDDFTSTSYDEVAQKTYPTWYDDFEARFPSDEWRDYSKLKEFLSLVKSTYREQATGDNLSSSVMYRINTTATIDKYPDDTSYTVVSETEDGAETGWKQITFTKDTAAYRLTKFRAEFPEIAEVQAFAYYYLFTEMFLMIDSRAKNMFIGFRGSPVTKAGSKIDRKAVAEPYDMDTALGTNNSGVLMFSYNLEDTDRVSAVITGEGGGSDAPVFNAQDSVLWCNFRDAFGAEITAMYRDLRATGAWSYNTIETLFETHQAKWPEAIFNEDAWIKYIVPLTDPVTVDEDTGELIRTDRYLTMLQGSKKEQRKWWLFNRFRYMDSKYVTGDASSKIISMRVFNSGNLVLTPAINMYTAVRFGGGTTPLRQRTNANETATFPYVSQSGVTEMETWIYSADMITDVGDLSVLYPNELDFSKATRLKNLKIGDSSTGYSNGNLRTLDVHNSSLLEKIDCRNCPNLNIAVNLEGSPRLKEAYFDGTSITGVDLVDGAAIEKLHLPGTITALTLLNLNKLTELVIPDYSHISRLMLANMDTSVADPVTILNKIPHNAQVNIQGIKMEAANATEIETFLSLLDNFKGVTRKRSTQGEWVYHETETAQVVGTIHTSSLTGAQLADYNSRYPYIVVSADHITCNLYYDNEDGTSNLHVEAVADGGNGTWNGTATKASDVQYSYTFVGWSKNKNATANDDSARAAVTMDRHIYAAFSRALRSYPQTFVNDDGTTVLQAARNWNYGETPTYSGATPVSTDSAMGSFQGWTPPLGPVTGATTYKATYESPVQDVEITDSWDTFIENIELGLADSKYKLGNYKPIDLGTEGNINFQIVGKSLDEDAEGNLAPFSLVAKEILNTSKRMNASGTTAGGYPASEMKKTTLPAIKTTLPSNIKSHIKTVKKTSWDAPNSTDIVSYEDIWFLSYREVFGGTNYEKSGNVYSSIFKDANTRKKYKPGASSADYWWLRSSYSSAYFGVVSYNGNDIYNYASSTLGVVFGFSLYPDTISDTWEEISGAISDGTYKTKYAIGDTKAVDLGDQGVICMQIAAFDADVDENGNTIPITFVCKHILTTYKRMNASNTTTGGYPASDIKTTIAAYESRLPETLKKMIIPAKKTSWDDNSSTDIESVEKLWLLSYREVFGGTDYEKSGVVYSDLFKSTATRIKKRYGTGSANSWWLRSADSSTYFSYVTSGGSNGYGSASNTLGVVFGFCVGVISE